MQIKAILELIKLLGPAFAAAWPYIQEILRIIRDHQQNKVGSVPPVDTDAVVADLVAAGATEQEARAALP